MLRVPGKGNRRYLFDSITLAAEESGGPQRPKLDEYRQYQVKLTNALSSYHLNRP